MPVNHPEIRVLEVSGGPAEIGEAHGEAERERIRRYADQFLGWLIRGASISLTEESLWAKWAPQVAVNERLAPGLIQEMRGIARGSGVPFERVFLLNSQLDVFSFRYLPMVANFGCSTFAVVSEAETGQTLVGQTYDMPEFLQDYLLLLRLNPSSGPGQLVFTFTGLIGACGLNEAGIGVSINYLSPLDTGLGRLHSVVVRQILAAQNLAGALVPPVVPPRAGGAHYLVADQNGNALSIETTGKRHSVFLPQKAIIAHTNHYLATELKELEYVRENSIGSSLARYATLTRFCKESDDNLTLSRLKELTRNHTSFPQSICAHAQPNTAEDQRSCTVAAMINVLAERTMHVTGGCACGHDYHSVTL